MQCEVTLSAIKSQDTVIRVAEETKKDRQNDSNFFLNLKNGLSPRVTSFKTRDKYKFTDAILCRAAVLQNKKIEI